MTLSEIALELDMSYCEVRNTLYRAMRKIRMKTVARRQRAEDFYDTKRSENRTWEH